MLKSLGISFEDEIVTKFCYDSNNKIIQVVFDSYYSGQNLVEKQCKLTIKGWKSASSKLYDDSHYADLENHMGIFSMILSVEETTGEDSLEFVVNTVNDNYISIIFDNADLSFDIL